MGWGIVCGGVAAAGLLWLAPSNLDAEHWSLAEPRWRQIELGVALCYAVLASLAAWRLRPRRLGFLLPLLLVTPSVLLKPAATGLPDWHPVTPLWLLLQLVLSAVAVGLAAGLLSAPPRARAAWVAALVAAVGPLLWLGVRWGELSDEHETVASGRVEALVRALAQRVGDDVYRHGNPPPTAAAWVERLGLAGWFADGEWVYWAPCEGAGAGPVKLRYTPPAPDSGEGMTVLSTAPGPVFGYGARPFAASIGTDGSLRWSWPAGAPPAVEQQRRAVEP